MSMEELCCMNFPACVAWHAPVGTSDPAALPASSLETLEVICTLVRPERSQLGVTLRRACLSPSLRPSTSLSDTAE